MSLSTLLSRLFGGASPKAGAAGGRGASYWISNPYHAVAVVPCPNACEAARRLGARRFLSAEAPALPLAGCAAAQCSCGYRHYSDRRASPRRAADRDGAPRGWKGGERRRSGGRRATDAI